MGPGRRPAGADGSDAASEGSEESPREEEAGTSGREEKAAKEEVEEEAEAGEEDAEEEEDGEEDAEEEQAEAEVEVEAEQEEEDEDEDEEEMHRRPGEEDGSCGGAEEDREDESSSPSVAAGPGDSEFILVKLADIRKEVQCPICLGIIKKTRTVMECLHRFCRDCIDKSMRTGNNECPACRTHCASRRSLRDDPNYDSLIAALYPDIEKYEEEELTFHEEERIRNKKIQSSIAATLRRQTEALGGKKRVTRTLRRGRNRGYMNFRGSQGSDDEDGLNGNDWERDSAVAEEPCMDVRPKRYKRSTPRPSRSMVTSDADEGCDGNEDGERETRSASPGRSGNREMLVWGKGGTRSQTRHGSGGVNGKNMKGSRISKMVDHIRSCSENDNELDVHLTLVPLGDHHPNLDRPHLSCHPTLTIRHICQFIAHQTSTTAEQIEILARKPHGVPPQLDPSVLPCKLASPDEEYQILGAHESVDGLHACYSSSLGNLVLIYRVKIHS